MDIQAYFVNIREAIIRELDGVESEITAAIAWLTDLQLGEALAKAARRGCRVRIALLKDAINRRAHSLTDRLQESGCKLYWIPDSGRGGGSLHHKFCVIDRSVVISGSYNWTQRASRADENIIVARGDISLATGYLDEFGALLKKYGYSDRVPVRDGEQLVRRLQAIQNLLLIDDYDTVVAQLPHLEHVPSLPQLPELIGCLERQDWSGALNILENILAQEKELINYRDVQIETLRLQLRTLEAEIVALSNEQAEAEQQIQSFALRQNQALGDVLGEYYWLRREVARRKVKKNDTKTNRETQSEAETNYQSYREDSKVLNEAEPLVELKAEEKMELKRLFREAAMRCHPDRVAESDREEATKLFVRLKEAQQKNDLETVRQIHKQLQEAKPFADPATILTQTDELRRQIGRLKLELDRLMALIRKLHASDTYRTLTQVDDWEEYFTRTRKRLLRECEEFRAELESE